MFHSSRRFMQGAALCLALLALPACGAGAPAAEPEIPTISPSTPAVQATEAVMPTMPPVNTPAATAEGGATTGDTDSAQLTLAAQEYLTSEGSPAATNSTVEIQKVEGDFARVRVVPSDLTAGDPTIVFLQRQNGQWTPLSYGTAFGPEFYTQFGIPQSLAMEAELPATDGTAGAFTPLGAEECQALQAIAGQVLGRQAEVGEVPMSDSMSGATGNGCGITVRATGAELGNFTDFLSVMQALKTGLTALGWTEDPAYLADGPTGTATAFRQDEKLILLSVGWEPSPDANCPADQPISACNVQPAQQLYTISILAGQTSQP